MRVEAGIRYQRHIDNKEGRAINITIPIIAAMSATLILAPVAHTEPCGADCGNPYFYSNEPNNAQFLHNVYASGITGAPHGLISGARNTVCPELDEGVPENKIVADLEKYSGFSQIQAYVYIGNAVGHYCPNEYGKLS
jgi:hypothetical protein